MTWTPEWPTKPGFYWFYGRPWNIDRAPELTIVEVREMGPPEKSWNVYIVHGAVVYASERGEGFFQPIPKPTLPVEGKQNG